MSVEKIDVMGFELCCFANMSEASEFIATHAGIFVSLNAEVLYDCEGPLRKIVNSNYGYADGVGAVLAARALASRNVPKLPGCELWLQVLSRFVGRKVAIVGAKQDVLTKAVKKIESQFGEINVVFSVDGYYRDESAVVNALIDAKPDLVVVAMGQPKQEFFCSKLQQELPDAVFLPIGGSLDVYVGAVSRAPSWLVNIGCEWLYRLLKEPSRWRRQLVLPKFLLKVLYMRLFVAFRS